MSQPYLNSLTVTMCFVLFFVVMIFVKCQFVVSVTEPVLELELSLTVERYYANL